MSLGAISDMQTSVSPSVAGQWRILTSTNLDRLQERNETSFPQEVVDLLFSITSAIASITGFHDILTKELMNSLQWIAKSTLELRSAVAQRVSSSDMEVFLIPHGHDFNPRFMTDDSSDGRKGTIKSSASHGVVFCTTDLGLKCIRGVTKDQGTQYVEDILLMPKVLLQSTVDSL
jgi:hypothetical protein